MSKAFTPPPTMSEEDILAVADVRRSVWNGGFRGLGAGLAVGFGGHFLASRYVTMPAIYKQVSGSSLLTIKRLYVECT